MYMLWGIERTRADLVVLHGVGRAAICHQDGRPFFLQVGICSMSGLHCVHKSHVSRPRLRGRLLRWVCRICSAAAARLVASTAHGSRTCCTGRTSAALLCLRQVIMHRLQAGARLGRGLQQQRRPQLRAGLHASRQLP